MTFIALDLFCGGGGAALGLLRAGFGRVVGLDIVPQPDYPGEFVEADIEELNPSQLAGYDLIWASPPCQAFSGQSSRRIRAARENLIPATRNLLRGQQALSVIENVPGSPLRRDLVLELGYFVRDCGNHRRRYFELRGFDVPPPPLRYPYRPCTVALTGHGPYRARKGQPRERHLPAEAAAAVLGVEHIVSGTDTDRRWRINQAVPPLYAEYIGDWALRKLRGGADDRELDETGISTW